LRNSGELVVWGDDTSGQLSDAPVGDVISKIAAGGARQGLAIRDDGSLVLWGGLGVSAAVPPIPASMATESYIDAYIALTYMLAIRRDHLVETSGTFFDGSPSGSPSSPPAGLRAHSVAGGSAHGIAIKMNGRLEAWGLGLAGFVPPPEGRFTAVSARSTYSIALRADGTLFGWGSIPAAPGIFNDWVSDGAGHFLVPGERFVAIAAGNTHIVALRADGTVLGWGTNTFGETQAPTNVRFTALAAGQGFSIGLDEEGLIHAWGNPAGGIGSVPPGKFYSIAAGARHASALRAEAPH
jgi:alpha-tubulin suppressor-like RCC1 family protein